MASYEALTVAQAQSIADMVNEGCKALGITLNRLARDAGVAQSMAFRASRALIQYRTPNVRRLELYVQIALNRREAPQLAELDRSVAAYLSAGGEVTALNALVRAVSANLSGGSVRAPDAGEGSPGRRRAAAGLAARGRGR